MAIPVRRAEIRGGHRVGDPGLAPAGGPWPHTPRPEPSEPPQPQPPSPPVPKPKGPDPEQTSECIQRAIDAFHRDLTETGAAAGIGAVVTAGEILVIVAIGPEIEAVELVHLGHPFAVGPLLLGLGLLGTGIALDTYLDAVAKCE